MEPRLLNKQTNNDDYMSSLAEVIRGNNIRFRLTGAWWSRQRGKRPAVTNSLSKSTDKEVTLSKG